MSGALASCLHLIIELTERLVLPESVPDDLWRNPRQIDFHNSMLFQCECLNMHLFSSLEISPLWFRVAVFGENKKQIHNRE